ncbi:MAG TPA: DUF6789 family protein [Candidatus Bathyarchaeia archaeon]|nr:DUF6789 family protein [Candidatus Bathyarchaeia archaeon]
MSFVRRRLSVLAPLSINRRGLTFVGTVAFMTGFFAARAFAIQNPNVVVVKGGIHFHHFWYGLGMVTLSGWLGIAFNRPRLVRTYAIIFGLGAGLIGDEIGLLLTFGDYQSSLTTDFFVGVIGFIILATTLVRYRKIVAKDIIHTSWNERLVYLGINLTGLSVIFFAVNSLTPGAVLAAIGIVLVISGFEAARAGIVAGLVAGGIAAVGDFFLVENYDVIGRTLEGTVFAPTSPIGSLEAATIYVIAVDVFLSGVIGGAILGLIFSLVHDRYLKNRSLRTRGIVFGIALWIVLSVTSLGSEFGALYDVISTVIGLVAYLVYGILLARFYPRFKRNISENLTDTVPAS